MAASLHVLPSRGIKRKKLHGDSDIKSISLNYQIKRTRSRSYVTSSTTATPPPSASSSLPSPNNSVTGEFDDSYEYTTSPPTTGNSPYQHTPENSVSPPAIPDDVDEKFDETGEKVDEVDEATCISIVNESSDTAKNSDNLESNPDYISLCSALNLLYAQKRKVQNDMVILNRLKRQIKQYPTRLQDMLNAKPGSVFPTRNTIVKCPIVDFTKYGLAFSDEQQVINEEMNKQKSADQCLFKVSSLFD